jgi:Thiopurine S-methyltransferase (TPMT)
MHDPGPNQGVPRKNYLFFFKQSVRTLPFGFSNVLLCGRAVCRCLQGLALSFSFYPSSLKTLRSMVANWEAAWHDILHQGGSPRWKVDDPAVKEQALQRILQYCSCTDQQSRCTSNDDDPHRTLSLLHILCPLAGDDPFVALAWQRGHAVTSIDLVPAAVALQRQQISRCCQKAATATTTTSSSSTTTSSSIDATAATATTEKEEEAADDWTETVVAPALTKWTHCSGRATCYVGDALQSIHGDLHGTFDAVYDKGAFGALEPSMRAAYGARLAEYLRPGTGILYTEVKIQKNKEVVVDRTVGPPFHVDQSDLMATLGSHFDYVADLGQLYEILLPPGMAQTGHVLRRQTLEEWIWTNNIPTGEENDKVKPKGGKVVYCQPNCFLNVIIIIIIIVINEFIHKVYYSKSGPVVVPVSHFTKLPNHTTFLYSFLCQVVSLLFLLPT